MKTKAYKYRFLLSGLTFTLIMCSFFFSCQKEEELPINEPFDYEQIEIEHNKGLDFIFEHLKKEGVGKKSDLKSATNVVSLVEKMSTDYVEKRFEIKINPSPEYSEFSQKLKNLNNNLKSAKDQRLWSSNCDDKLTKNQKKILDELKAILNNSKNVDNTIKKIKKLEDHAVNLCDNEELATILIATSVGRYSLQYWEKNFDNWMLEFGGIEKSMLLNSRLKSGCSEDIDWQELRLEMVEWDIKGAIVGGIGGGFIGGVAGTLVGPAGTVIGVISGMLYSGMQSAIIGSVVGAIFYFIDLTP